MAEEKDTGLLEWIKSLVDRMGLWLEQYLGDSPEQIRVQTELGLKTGAKLTDEQRQVLARSREKTEAVLDDLLMVGQTLVAVCEGLARGNLSGWDVFHIIAETSSAELLEMHAPRLAAAGRALGVLTEDPEAVKQLALDRLLTAFTDAESDSPRLDWWAALTGIGLWKLAPRFGKPLEKLGLGLRVHYGWDPEPDSPTPLADLATGRAGTLVLHDLDNPELAVALTVVPIPGSHGGGAVVSLSGSVGFDVGTGENRLTVQTALAGGLNLLVSPLGFRAGSNPQAQVRIRWSRSREKAFRIGSKTGSRIEINRVNVGGEASSDGARLRLGAEEATLVLAFGESDGLLKNLSGAEIRSTFSTALVLDSSTGVHLEGGTRFVVRLPVATSKGRFSLHYLELGLEKGKGPKSLALTLAAGIAFPLGPFTAVVDRAGFRLDLALIGDEDDEAPAHRIGGLGYDAGFLSPKGLGLSITKGPIKGGGFLWWDPAAGEYAGVLDIKFVKPQLKALVIISTKAPVGEERTTWSVLFLLFVQWDKGYPLFWGLTLNGVGGMIGLNHGADVPALQAGLKSGMLDDILFPKDPVADAPRILPRLRTAFPVSAESLTVGPFVEIRYLSTKLVTARLGLIAQIDGILPGEQEIKLARLVLFGTLSVVKPEPPAKPILQLKVDVLGHLDLVAKQFGLLAQLRDSKIGGLSLQGSFLLRIDWGETSAFLLAFGGFHPDFKDLPPGVPSSLARLGISPIKRGGFTIEISGYLAVTSNSFQIGFKGSAKAKLGPVGLEGKLEVDGLFTRDMFVLKVVIVARVTYKGRSLAGVDVTATLQGPGYWRLWGTATFEILWWDISKPFDIDWGEAAPPALDGSTDVAGLLAESLRDPGNWRAALPAGADELATLASGAAPDAVPAHPLAALSFTQRVAPFNLTLQRFGDTAVRGANRFDLAGLRIGSRVLQDPPVVTESFARSHFLDVSPEEQLSLPSFEPLPAGVAVGSPGFSAGPAVSGDLDYETFYLDLSGVREPTRPRAGLRAELAALGAMSTATVNWQARAGAVARSPIRSEPVGPAVAPRFAVTAPALAVVSAETLGAPTEAVVLSDAGIRSVSLAQAALGARADRAALRVVEQHEEA